MIILHRFFIIHCIFFRIDITTAVLFSIFYVLCLFSCCENYLCVDHIHIITTVKTLFLLVSFFVILVWIQKMNFITLTIIVCVSIVNAFNHGTMYIFLFIFSFFCSVLGIFISYSLHWFLYFYIIQKTHPDLESKEKDLVFRFINVYSPTSVYTQS